MGDRKRRRAFDNKAMRAWWQTHIDAWKKTGMTAAEYCRKQGLAYHAFRNWRRAITDWEALKSANLRSWHKRYRPITEDARRRAKQAFWAMHVEAWTWSGLTLREYAGTHRLSPHSLRRWRNMIEAAEFEVDWRTMLHPSALPLISNKISTDASENPPRPRLTNVNMPRVPEQARRMAEDIQAASSPCEKKRRRSFSDEQRIAILLEVERHGESMSSVSRAYGLSRSMLFRWREKYGVGEEKPPAIVPVRVLETPGAQPSSAKSLISKLPCPFGMKEVVLADGRCVFASQDADPDAVRRVVAERENGL